MILLLYLALGALAGLLAGLFGVGGGLIIVPALIWAFHGQGFSSDIVTHLAIGTSLATIVITALSSIRAHHQRAAVDWPIVLRMAPGIALGSVLGAVTGVSLSGPQLQLALSLFMLSIALHMATGYLVKSGRALPGTVGLSAVGAVIGWASALFGIGGGSLSVPFLCWCNVRMQRAVAVSAACGLPIALVGSLSYMVEGQGVAALPPASTGFVYWPAFVGIVLTSSVFAGWGAVLAHRLPAVMLKRLFALFLLLIGIKLLFGSGLLG
jgi:uncharacterized membrane protein YfcA